MVEYLCSISYCVGYFMERRDVIKSGVAVTLGALLGANLINKKQPESEPVITAPKQKKPYNIYAPMPFNYKLLDAMKEMNKRYKKSQIKTVYNNIPYPLFSYFEENFQSVKGFNGDIHSFGDFAKYVKYAKELGFNFVYILNSPRPFPEDTYKKFEKPLLELIDKIEELGCHEFKLANQQLVKILSDKKPHLKLSASTSFEFHNISQYENLFNTYPQIKSANISIDDNRNYTFLKNLKRKFPNINIEVMLNEPCHHGCPARICHASTFFSTWDCRKLIEQIGELRYHLESNVVYPWWLPYYQDIGINTFKLFTFTFRADMKSVDFIDYFMYCIEYGAEYLNAFQFFTGMYGMNFKFKNNTSMSEIIPYLPKMEHFVEYGHKCSTICRLDCNYCTSNLEKIKQILNI